MFFKEKEYSRISIPVKKVDFFYDYQIYIDISDRHIYQIPFVVKNEENALRDRTFIYFNIQKKV